MLRSVSKCLISGSGKSLVFAIEFWRFNKFKKTDAFWILADKPLFTRASFACYSSIVLHLVVKHTFSLGDKDSEFFTLVSSCSSYSTIRRLDSCLSGLSPLIQNAASDHIWEYFRASLPHSLLEWCESTCCSSQPYDCCGSYKGVVVYVCSASLLHQIHQCVWPMCAFGLRFLILFCSLLATASISVLTHALLQPGHVAIVLYLVSYYQALDVSRLIDSFRYAAAT